jgi:DNA excision repair protein ERCC-4
MRVVVDDRERRSGIIKVLEKSGADVIVKRLLFGDYLIDGQLVVERKTGFDFAESIKSGRLFRQVRELKKIRLRVVLLIEGDPYQTASAIKPRAVQGAILSMCANWQMPIIFSSSVEDSAALFKDLSRHLGETPIAVPQRCAIRPKRLVNRQLYIIQGLPGVGARLAQRLLSQFKSVAGVFSAKVDELVEVEGVGVVKARQIREVLDADFRDRSGQKMNEKG